MKWSIIGWHRQLKTKSLYCHAVKLTQFLLIWSNFRPFFMIVKSFYWYFLLIFKSFYWLFLQYFRSWKSLLQTFKIKLYSLVFLGVLPFSRILLHQHFIFRSPRPIPQLIYHSFMIPIDHHGIWVIFRSCWRDISGISKPKVR